MVSEVFTKEGTYSKDGRETWVWDTSGYSITGEGGIEDSQPITVKMWQGQMGFCSHNGNLVNARTLRADLERSGSISRLLLTARLYLILLARTEESRDPFKAFTSISHMIMGAYSLCILTPQGVIAAKDPNGFRPLCLGELDIAYIVCSETCALDAVGAEFIRELDPEKLFIPTPDSKNSRCSLNPRVISEQQERL